MGLGKPSVLAEDSNSVKLIHFFRQNCANDSDHGDEYAGP